MSSERVQTTLGDVCLKITDGAHASPRTVVSGKPMASVKDLTRFGVDLTSARLIPIEDFDALVKQGCKPEVGDVLIAKDGKGACQKFLCARRFQKSVDR
jgi:type I restriction enzyme S subunit